MNDGINTVEHTFFEQFNAIVRVEVVGEFFSDEVFPLICFVEAVHRDNVVKSFFILHKIRNWRYNRRC